MGVDTRKKLLLPAPTDSSTLQTSGDEVIPTDFATDLSRRTDHTSLSIPEDGSPITVNTAKKREKSENHLGRSGHHTSQTSLLIEYFEGGKGPNVHSRPSVRVKVTPSSAKKGKETKDHIQITEASGARKPSYTRRISLGPRNAGETQLIEGESISSFAEDSNLSARPPVEIEVLHKDQMSDLSGTSLSKDSRYMPQNPSEISSMPPESAVEINEPVTPQRTRSRSFTKNAAVGTAVGAAVGTAVGAMDTLKTPSRRRSRSLSRERITQKAIEKIRNEPGTSSRSKHKHGTKSHSRSVSEEHVNETLSSPKRRSSKHKRYEDFPSGESSLVTASQVSDGRSFRSGTSKSSINNPKLLETVEDAIRRLILPELTALKAEQKTQQNLQKFEKGNRDSVLSGSSVSKEELTRRVSKHASDPNVRGKPKLTVSRDEHRSGRKVSGESIHKKKSRHDKVYDSPSERSFERGMSEETVIRDESKSRKKNKDGSGLRDAAAGSLVGGLLTRAALKHHDSKSSIERRERRRKRSKSHSRSQSMTTSVADTEEIFYKHDVPPMPMRSAITTSDVTRDSILSERTSTPTSERRRHEIREVARGSPKEITPPSSRTPTRSPALQGRGGGYSKDSPRDDVSVHSEEEYHEDPSHHYRQAALSSALAGGGVMAGRQAFDHYDNREDYVYGHGRGLSPIQSVASFEEREAAKRESDHHAHSTGSMSSTEGHQKGAKLSAQSLTSLEAANLEHSNRPKGISLETGSEILGPHEFRGSDQDLSRDPTNESWYEGDDLDNPRDSIGKDSYGQSAIDVKRLTNFTDDSMDAPYLDKVTAAQQIRGVGANAEYIQTPTAVESAVASLHGSSIVDAHSTKSGHSRAGETYLESPIGRAVHREEYPSDLSSARDRGSPLKQQHGIDDQNLHAVDTRYDSHEHGSAANSPRHSAARSINDRNSYVPMTSNAIPDANDPLPEIMPGMDSKSDISTNPPDIQGPRGGPPYETPLQWPYHQATPPQSKTDNVPRSENTSAHEGLKAAAATMLSAAAGAGAAAALAQRDRQKNDAPRLETSRDFRDQSPAINETHQEGTFDDIGTGQGYLGAKTIPESPLPKDEGYQTEDQHARSVGALTPDYRRKNITPFAEGVTGGALGDLMLGDEEEQDPFVGRHMRHSSGNSHGMPSPLYDSATGRGIDRIESKDIRALMDHLTVRDAQRNARDTEILVTLVRSAAEMRNSFEDMKKYIADQDEVLVEVGNKQHEKTQRVIGGPRPQPAGAPRLPRKNSADEYMEDVPAKRRNVFRRALKGLSGKNTNDITKIEDMLNHLLDEVADLKAGQDIRPTGRTLMGDGLSSYEKLRDAPQEGYEQDGYEPEGRAGTASTGNQSGYFSNPPSRQGNRQQGYDRRRASQNRVSTVLEEHEENDVPLERHEQDVLEYENTEHMLTPTRELPRGGSVPLTPTRELPRGGSVPLTTPPAVHVPTGTQSNEHTPHTDKSRKHKSSSSSFFPKISRWSKTTASSAASNMRHVSGGNSARKERPYSNISHSGSDLHNYDVHDHYDPQGDDRLRSATSLAQDNNVNNAQLNANNDGYGSAADDDEDEDEDENRPPSPLIPSQVSEKPAYRAHRDSLNLQHPQPRQGPTARYQNHLESQVHELSSPISPSSDQFGSNPILARFGGGGGGNRNSGGVVGTGTGTGNLSPISDVGYEEGRRSSGGGTSVQGPPRPPKVKDNGPLVPSKISLSDASEDKRPTFAERSAPATEYNQANSAPRSTSGNVPNRKPLTGPRPITTSGNYSPDRVANLQKTRYRRSPNHIAGSSGEDVTF